MMSHVLQLRADQYVSTQNGAPLNGPLVTLDARPDGVENVALDALLLLHKQRGLPGAEQDADQIHLDKTELNTSLLLEVGLRSMRCTCT